MVEEWSKTISERKSIKDRCRELSEEVNELKGALEISVAKKNKFLAQWAGVASELKMDRFEAEEVKNTPTWWFVTRTSTRFVLRVSTWMRRFSRWMTLFRRRSP